MSDFNPDIHEKIIINGTECGYILKPVQQPEEPIEPIQEPEE